MGIGFISDGIGIIFSEKALWLLEELHNGYGHQFIVCDKKTEFYSSQYNFHVSENEEDTGIAVDGGNNCKNTIIGWKCSGDAYYVPFQYLLPFRYTSGVIEIKDVLDFYKELNK